MPFRKVIVVLFIFLQANVISKLGLSYYNVMYFLFALVLLNFLLSKKKSYNTIFFLVSLVLLIFIRKFSGMTSGSFQLSTILCFPAFFISILPESIESGADRSFYKLVLKSLVVLFVLEFAISYVEFVLHISVLGYTNDTYGVHLGPKSRATALLGASLSNSLIVCGLLFFILNSNLKDKYKYCIWSFGFLSLMCFQGRVAMVVSFLYLILYFVSHLKNNARRNVTLIVILCGIVGIIAIAFYAGIGERLLNIGMLDDSSSAVRTKMFEYLLDNYTLKDFLWGMSMNDMQFLMAKMHVLVIECFFVIHLLFFGLVFLIVFYLQYVVLMRKMLRGYNAFFKFIAVPAFIVVAFTNNSFASDYVSLSMFLLYIKIFSPSIFDKIVPGKYLVGGADRSSV